MWIVTLHVLIPAEYRRHALQHRTTVRFATEDGAFKRAAQLSAYNIAGATVSVVEVAP